MTDPVWSKGPPATILLATDLSCRCDRALDRAALLAREWGAKLLVLHVLNPAESFLESIADRPAQSGPPARLAEARIRRDLPGDLPDLEVRVEEGDPATLILDVARQTGAGLIVTGVARDETLGRWLLGATVDRLVRRAPVPVLIVKTRPRPYKDVLVATDFSESSVHALNAAGALFPEAGLTLLHAFETPFGDVFGSDSYRERFGDLEEKAVAAFIGESALPEGQKQRIQVRIEHGAPETAIRDHMNTRETPLLVLASHGRSAVFDVLIGSVARRILASAPGDVLLVREPRAAGAAPGAS